MRKLWCNSILIAVVLFSIGCKQHTASETETGDTSALSVDTTIATPDNTAVNADTVSINDTIKGNSAANPAINGDSKVPGSKPKPGKMSQVDSIKASYPPKK